MWWDWLIDWLIAVRLVELFAWIPAGIICTSSQHYKPVSLLYVCINQRNSDLIWLPPIPQFTNKSWNFIFSFWNFKSHYRQYHDLKIKVEILYSHFGFSNLTTVNTTIKKIQLENWNLNSKDLKTACFYVKAFYDLKSLKKIVQNLALKAFNSEKVIWTNTGRHGTPQDIHEMRWLKTCV